MNERRYRSYVHVTRLLRSDLFGELDRDILQDAAEGMLLARSREEGETEELSTKASTVLAELVLLGRVNASTALEVQSSIHACGPGEPPVGAHAGGRSVGKGLGAALGGRRSRRGSDRVL